MAPWTPPKILSLALAYTYLSSDGVEVDKIKFAENISKTILWCFDHAVVEDGKS